MRTYAGTRKAVCWALSVATILSCFIFTPPTHASGFLNDSTLKGAFYYWQRQRDRKDMDANSEHYREYRANLHHATVNSSLDFSSGYAADFIGLDAALFGALEMSHSGPAAPNEIGFSKANNRWDEEWVGDRSGVSLYKAALKMKTQDYWLRAGYLQPQGQTLLTPHWSFLPGTYRAVEVGMHKDFSDAGALDISYIWSDRYKAPWYRNLYKFRKADGTTGIPWLHAVGARVDFKNKLILEGSWGQAANYMDQFFAKASWSMPLAGNDLLTSYQFYGAHDRESGGAANNNDVYDGLAWLQALTFGYNHGPFDFRLEGTWVKAEGNQGFFLQRMTPSYASSNGRLDIWWDARSDWNANGEKAIFAGVMYDLAAWDLAGWTVGTSYVWGWDAKPSSNPQWDQRQRIRESAWNLDLLYTVQQGRAKDTLFKLHFTRYDNHSDLPSFSGGFGNLFQDEKDVKFIVIAPFTIF